MTSVGIMASGVGSTDPGEVILLEPFVNFSAAPWTTAGAATIVAARTGNGAQIVGGSANNAVFTIPALKESDILTVGAAFRWTDANTLSRDVFRFSSDSGATLHNRVTATSGGDLNVTRSASGIASAGISTLARNVWYFIEAQIRLHDTAGYVTVRIDGVVKINQTPLDTRNAGTKTVYDRVLIGGFVNGATVQLDDLYIKVGGGSFRGDIPL